MSLEDVEVHVSLFEASGEAEAFIARAKQQIQRYFDVTPDGERQRVGQSDFRLVDQTLQAILQMDDCCEMFCEWGSGFGVNAALAAMHGMTAVGMEIDASLIARAERLVADLAQPPRFYHGNFLPAGASELVDAIDNIWLMEVTGSSAYESHDLTITDYDMIFAYPAPGEGRFIADVFDKFARDGAILLSFHGSNEIRVRRKRASNVSG